MKPIEKAWEEYRARVLPPDAPEIQVSETRLAFYSGAGTMFYGLAVGLDEDAEPTENDMAKMNAIDAELKEWVAGLNAERPGGSAN